MAAAGPFEWTSTSVATTSSAAVGIQYLREVGVPPVTLSLTTYDRYTPITLHTTTAADATDLYPGHYKCQPESTLTDFYLIFRLFNAYICMCVK